ncbi:MAG: EAL domain-containing protein [Ruminococcaceae bacterium]|nr:EAL domain-containing protein [Oscillospiraceae bacterium]
MDEKKTGSPELVRLMLAPYDELVEVDIPHGRIRALHHTEGKYFVPIVDSSVRDIFSYASEYMIHPEDREAYLAFNDPGTMPQRLAASETPGMLRAEFRYKLLTGGWRRVEQVNVGGAGQGLPEGVFYAFVFDLETASGAADADTEKKADQYNELTGLMWEETFFTQSKTFLRAHPEGWCMVAIDLEHFKLFNEWYGRKRGDLLLAKLGAHLGNAAAEVGGLACYYGQDDFVLVCPEDRPWLDRLYAELHALVTEHGASVGFMPAFGVTPLALGDSVEDAYDRAALAAHRAKENYHDRVCVFDPAMFRQTEREYQILSDFQQALEEHELFIVLQPQCVISTGHVVGAESLVRWRKADGTMVSPGVFVPILEEYGFVTELDRYVWEQVCAWQRKWIDGGHTPVPISVNVSQIDIFTIDVPAYLEELVRKYDLPVETVKVEITESAYVENGPVVDAVQRLREKGFLVLMDDFGSGYSSLNMLRSLNVDIIKLDAQFLRMNQNDRKGLRIIETIVNMARTMSVPIIVEGVETQEETDFLSGLGCSYVQGYFFYRPMPVKDFEALIADPGKIDTVGFRLRSKNQARTREFLDPSLFSDAVLNNLLGPVAFFARSGDAVNVVRYNRWFFEEAGDPALFEQTDAFLRRLVPGDLPRLYELLEMAEASPTEGAGGVLRFRRSDGAVAEFRLFFYYMEEDDNGKKYYASLQNLTRYLTLDDHIRLLSAVCADSVLFVRRRGEGWSFQTVAHGLEDALGMTAEAFERQCAALGFFDQMAHEAEKDALSAESGARTVEFPTADGREVDVSCRCVAVQDRESGVEYILVVRRL